MTPEARPRCWCGFECDTYAELQSHLMDQAEEHRNPQRSTQVLITTKDGQQWLIDLWPSGEVEVSYRPEPYGSVPWTPAEFSSVGATVEVTR